MYISNIKLKKYHDPVQKKDMSNLTFRLKFAAIHDHKSSTYFHTVLYQGQTTYLDFAGYFISNYQISYTLPANLQQPFPRQLDLPRRFASLEPSFANTNCLALSQFEFLFVCRVCAWAVVREMHAG